MRRYDLFSSLFWLLCGVLIALGSLRLPLGTISRPGPGFIPLLLGMILSGLALVLFFGSFIQKGAGGEKKVFWLGKTCGKKVVSTVASMLIYAFAVDHLGFVTATFFLMFFLFKVIFTLKWSIALGAALLTSLCTYFLFIVWLEVQVPLGLFGI